MLLRTWAAVGAAVCGIAVASLPGGSASPWASFLILIAILIGVGVTAIHFLFSYTRTKAVGRIPKPVNEIELNQNDRRSQRDGEIAQEIGGPLHGRTIEWLQMETFAAPWRDYPVDPLRDLVLVDARQRGFFDPELEDVVGRLTAASRAFIEIYDSQTIADPMIAHSTWRMIGWRGSAGEVALVTDSERIAVQARLREAAARICESFNSLTSISRQRYPSG